MLISRTKQELRDFISGAKSQGKKVALVPTMGALHEGHISLLHEAKKHADILITTIFVNPTQFGPNEDFGRYPRQEEDDIALLKSNGCDAVFLPSVHEIYGDNFSTAIHVTRNADILCGAFRPGHFDGVALVVSKLLNIAGADVAVFGEKDYQQLYIIRQMAKDLNIPTEIIGAPTLRESTGLALSSRNKYLTPIEKEIASTLNVKMRDVLAAVKAGADIQSTLDDAKNQLVAGGFTKVDYIEIREGDNLEVTENLTNKSRIFAAAWIGKTRLIDNIPA